MALKYLKNKNEKDKIRKDESVVMEAVGIWEMSDAEAEKFMKDVRNGWRKVDI
ncbi:MAG: hypothetical protein Q7S74_04965 [Nanoarchaeota archaeon]|nr:hypothetical protein [Nanoarchaeota archaeon]